MHSARANDAYIFVGLAMATGSRCESTCWSLRQRTCRHRTSRSDAFV